MNLKAKEVDGIKIGLPASKHLKYAVKIKFYNILFMVRILLNFMIITSFLTMICIFLSEFELKSRNLHPMGN